jgi:hypothetical protein
MSSLIGNQGMRSAAGVGLGNPAGSTIAPGKFKGPSGLRGYNTPNYTPEQLQLYQSLFKHVAPDSYLSRLAGGDESAVRDMQAPAWRDFNQAQGQLASRFTGFGGQGSLSARGGSGFKNTVNQQSVDFATQLQAQRHQLQQNAIRELMGLSGDLLGQRPYDSNLYQKQPRQGGFGGLIGGALGGLGGFFAGGPAGALQGAQLGYSTFSGL